MEKITIVIALVAIIAGIGIGFVVSDLTEQNQSGSDTDVIHYSIEGLYADNEGKHFNVKYDGTAPV